MDELTQIRLYDIMMNIFTKIAKNKNALPPGTDHISSINITYTGAFVNSCKIICNVKYKDEHISAIAKPDLTTLDINRTNELLGKIFMLLQRCLSIMMRDDARIFIYEYPFIEKANNLLFSTDPQMIVKLKILHTLIIARKSYPFNRLPLEVFKMIFYAIKNA